MCIYIYIYSIYCMVLTCSFMSNILSPYENPLGFFRQEYGNRLPCPPPGDLPNPGIEPRSPTLQADSLLSEPPGKPKNTGVGSLSLLQGIFLTQKSNQGLLNCRWILYQLSNQGNICEIYYVFMCWWTLGHRLLFSVSIFFRYIPRSGTGESYSSSILSFLMEQL